MQRKGTGADKLHSSLERKTRLRTGFFNMKRKSMSRICQFEEMD